MPKIRQTVHHSTGTYVRGSVLPATHPLVVAAPHLFDATGGGVEQATAEPGEKRSVVRSSKKVAAKKSAAKKD